MNSPKDQTREYLWRAQDMDILESGKVSYFFQTAEGDYRHALKWRQS